jgi:outer membrane protein assembly factor BamA
VGVACLPACLFRAKAGEPPLVGDITIVGNKAVSTKEIVKRLALTKSGYRFFVKVGDAFPFDPELVRVDRLRVERVYQAFGYYSAKVVDILTKDDRGRINITFVVNEGPPTKVAHLGVGGLKDLPPKVERRVLRNLPLGDGDVFSEDAYDATKEAVRSRLKDFGYWEAIDEGRVVIDPIRRTAEITFDVATGPRYRIRNIAVVGSRDVSQDRVRNASGLKADQFLSPELLADAQHKVQGLGVFAQTLVKPRDFDREKALADVDIQVTDAPFQTVDAGVGIEADQTRQLGRLRGVYTHKNLGINLEKIIAGGSVGYAWLPTIWQYYGGGTGKSGIIADLQLTYVQPRLLLLPIDAHAGVSYAKDLTPAFGFQRVGAEIGTLFYVDAVPGLTFAPSFHYDFYFDVSAGATQATIPGQPPTAFATSGCGPDLNGATTPTCRLAYAEGRLAYDLRDDPLATRRGAYLAFIVQYSTPGIADFNYVRINPEARGYVPVPYLHNFTFAARLNYGQLHQLGGRQPPGVARFFAGGANSVRASSAEQLGPREYVVLPNPKGSGYIAGAPVPVGGDQLLEGSAELRWYTPLDGLTVAAFFDIGELALTENNPVTNTSGSFQYGPGIGFRYHTPFGPLRLDFAYRISHLQTSPVVIDTTNVKNPATAGVPTTVFGPGGASNYTIGADCKLASGQQAYQCYSDARFQFFLTLGDPF